MILCMQACRIRQGSHLHKFHLQAVDDTQINEVAKFIYSDHLTEGAMSLRDLGLSRK